MRTPRRQRITPALRHILALAAEGLSKKQIAAERGTTESTVKHQFMDLFDRLGADNTAHAVALGIRKRLID